jgi:hypothetical protein
MRSSRSKICIAVPAGGSIRVLKITTSEEMSLIGKDGYGAAAASSTRGRRGRTHSPWLPVSWIY